MDVLNILSLLLILNKFNKTLRTLMYFIDDFEHNLPGELLLFMLFIYWKYIVSAT